MDLNRVTSREDPHGVHALLAALRGGGEGDDRNPEPPSPAPPSPSPSGSRVADAAASNDSTASADQIPGLSNPLAWLRSDAQRQRGAGGYGDDDDGDDDDDDDDAAADRAPPADSVRHATFSQALGHLSRLSAQPAFLHALLEEKAKQDEVERELARQRREVLAASRAGDDAAKAAQSVAERRAALRRFDRRALARWDKVLASQQSRFEELGVPCFYRTTDPHAISRQRRVLDVLASLVDDGPGDGGGEGEARAASDSR